MTNNALQSTSLQRITSPLVCTAPAKLNLFLHVVNQRRDGYHDLETFFQLIDLKDTLSFYPRQDEHITLACPSVKGSIEHNLIYRAAKVLQQAAKTQRLSANIHSPGSLGAHIEVLKNIPQGGGLGGGSSNAATTLLALNQLWSLNLTIEQLSKLGGTLGADVPVFIRGQTAWASGTGDELMPANTQPTFWFVLAKPAAGISTASVFKHANLKRNTPSEITALRTQFNTQTPPGFGPNGELWQKTRNDCQPVSCLLHPPLQIILNWLSRHAPARMTGTGSTCFTMHETQSSAEALLRKLQQQADLHLDWCCLAQGVARWPSPKHPDAAPLA